MKNFLKYFAAFYAGMVAYNLLITTNETAFDYMCQSRKQFLDTITRVKFRHQLDSFDDAVSDLPNGSWS